MNKYNISRPRKYTKDGVEKTYWDRVGEMVEFEKQDGTVSRIIKIPAIGLEANVFPAEPREPKPYAGSTFDETQNTSPEVSSDEVTVADIPF